MNNRRMIFIVGAMRSGTTYLGKLINAHKDIRITQEFSLSFQRDNVSKMIKELTSSNFFGDLPHEECLQWSDEVARSYIRMLIDMELKRSGKIRYGDRTPLNTSSTQNLHQLFPDACFIHIIRDGRAVAASVLERQRADPRFRGKAWAPKCGDEAARSWVEAILSARAYGLRLPSDGYLELRYEDFIEQPHECVERIFSFIGEDIDDGVVHVRDSFFERPRSWQETLSEADLASFLSVEHAVKMLEELGYV